MNTTRVVVVSQEACIRQSAIWRRRRDSRADMLCWATIGYIQLFRPVLGVSQVPLDSRQYLSVPENAPCHGNIAAT